MTRPGEIAIIANVRVDVTKPVMESMLADEASKVD